MAEYEVESNVPGLTNYSVPVRGTDVTAYLGVQERRPDHWAYSLWDAADNLISTGWLDMTGMPVTAEQVARIAFLTDVEYGTE
jgi:hypothetical protein